MALAMMGILLGLLLLGHLTVDTYGRPILEVPESITGPWKGDVNIPCTYGPLQGYTQVLVKWLVQRGSDPVTIFLRDSSGDHIQQAKYQGRLHVSQKVPGDVSLQLSTLEMDDQSYYTCEVTWQTPDGNQVVRDEITELRVQKDSPKLLKTKTEAPTTMRHPLKATSTVKQSWDWTTDVDGYLGATSAGPEHVYEAARVHAREANDSGDTMRVAIFASGCPSDEPASQNLGNNYSDEPCIGQEYQIIAQINGDYARLLDTVPLDYEFLATEGKTAC
ncbi:PREDICTED: V-set and immunoglobulin domain-containing protein 4 isoform X2 [Rhinopithecus bieti]|uniref:V-set and immunoglobulin domain containing 4 n=1 Tax=Rhinopithecus bieti TaxID=61621 RepID=A0A2K6KZP3_RHIBE|nr:PREDICTED: V-set and immunoglobulin domain-containing protein 4 isoform X2 [Rhinopithecus bieti]